MTAANTLPIHAREVSRAVFKEFEFQIERVITIGILMMHPDSTEEHKADWHVELMGRCAEITHPADLLRRFGMIERTGRPTEFPDPVFVGH